MTRREFRAAESYLLCSLLAVGGLMSNNLVPPGSVYDVNRHFLLTVLAQTTYEICWGSNDLNVTIGSDVYTSTGAGTCIQVYTGPNTIMDFFGTFAGTTVTVVVRRTGKVPIPSGQSIVLNNDGQNATVSWNLPPANIAKTEVYKSTDNIHFSLAATVLTPGTSGQVAMVNPGSTLYVILRWVKADGTFGPFTTSGSVPDVVVSGWANRVVTNGGPAVSKLTIAAAQKFVVALKPTTVWAKFKVVNIVAPDEIMPCRTPLVVGPGIDPWTFPLSAGSKATNMTIDGYLSRTGANTYTMDTGLVPSTTFAANDGGITVYAFTNPGDTSGGGMLYNAGCYTAQSFIITSNQTDDNGARYFCDDGASAAVWLPGSPPPTGYYSGNRVGNTNTLYHASSTFAHAAVGGVGGANGGTQPINHAYAFGVNGNGTVFGCVDRLSFVAIHSGFTAAESLAVFNAVQAMRQIFGGGFT